MEAAMVIAVLLVMLMLMKLNAKKDNVNTTLPDDADDTDKNE
jgi:hypothetical protein